MVFKINSKDFLKALKDARANISPRRNDPIMDYQSYWLSVVFSSEDLEVSTVSRGGNVLTVKVSIQIVKIANGDEAPKSKVAVSQRLYGIVRTLDPQDLTITLTADKMEIQHACGVVRFQTSTGGLIAVHSPLTLFNDEIIFHSMYDADELRLILSTLKPFMGADEFRPVMKGICAKCTDDYTDYVASDGHRLCRIRLPRGGWNEELLIPDIAVAVIQKVLPKTGKVHILYKHHGLTQIEVGNIQYRFMQTEGQFPNYQKVIPDLGPCVVSLERQKLVRSLNRIMALDRNGASSLKMIINLDDISLFFSYDGTTFEERVPIYDRVATGEHYVFVNPYNLLKCVSNLQSDIIQLSLNSSRDPVVIHPNLPLKDGDTTVLFMPMMG